MLFAREQGGLCCFRESRCGFVGYELFQGRSTVRKLERDIQADTRAAPCRHRPFSLAFESFLNSETAYLLADR